MYGYESNDIVDLLGSKATVVLNNMTTLEGYLYTIDPISHHVVLFQPDQHNVVIVFQHDIQQLTHITVNAKDRLDTIDQHIPQAPSLSSMDIEDRRQKLIAVLTQHRVPIEYHDHDPVIHVLGCARVESPYVATSVVCDNALIRQRVRNMILEL
ncbi:hypothetical protein BD560DRAFT_434712 [Blakeslea trispora]|nr:hypothetical protein BD560DRAFT_434712 [Blakeslea trispora]